MLTTVQTSRADSGGSLLSQYLPSAYYLPGPLLCAGQKRQQGKHPAHGADVLLKEAGNGTNMFTFMWGEERRKWFKSWAFDTLETVSNGDKGTEM